MEWLKAVHFYRKVPSDLTEATLAGGSLSLISALVMAYLFFSNFSAFLQVGPTHEATTPDATADGARHRLSLLALRRRSSTPCGSRCWVYWRLSPLPARLFANRLRR